MKSFKKKFILTKKTSDILAFELKNPELVSGGKQQPIQILPTRAGGRCRRGFIWSNVYKRCIPVLAVKPTGGNTKG